MAGNSIERLGGEYDLESRESAFSLHTSNKRQHINSININKCGIMLILEGVVFCLIPCTTV